MFPGGMNLGKFGKQFSLSYIINGNRLGLKRDDRAVKGERLARRSAVY